MTTEDAAPSLPLQTLVPFHRGFHNFLTDNLLDPLYSTRKLCHGRRRSIITPPQSFLSSTVCSPDEAGARTEDLTTFSHITFLISLCSVRRLCHDRVRSTNPFSSHLPTFVSFLSVCIVPWSPTSFLLNLLRTDNFILVHFQANSKWTWLSFLRHLLSSSFHSSSLLPSACSWPFLQCPQRVSPWAQRLVLEPAA